MGGEYLHDKFLFLYNSEGVFCMEWKKMRKKLAVIVYDISILGGAEKVAVNVANELKRAGLHIPIMIGGATTSQLHVALKIAPVYGGPVVWMKDASQNALVAAKLMNEQEERKLSKELDDQYDQLRREYNEEQEKLLSLDEARKNKLDIFNE